MRRNFLLIRTKNQPYHINKTDFLKNFPLLPKIQSKCYIINNRTNKKLEFQFNPTSVPYSRSAVYTTIDSPGISYPLTQYTGGNIREFPIELFYYDLHYDKNHVRKSSGKIKEARQFLEALLPPEKNTKTFVPPTFTFALS